MSRPLSPTLSSGLRSLGVLANARHPRIHQRWINIPSFFAGWAGTEAAQLFAARSVWKATRGVMTSRSEEGTRADLAGAIVHGVAAAGFARIMWEGHRSRDELEASLLGVVPQSFLDERPSTRRAAAYLPLLTGLRAVDVKRRVPYVDGGAYRNSLDIYTADAPPPSGSARKPVVIEIHGGGWVVGNNYEQGVPLLTHLVRNGWVGFSINYRLAPKSKFPDQLIDVKRAIGWVKSHAADYGGDPDFVVVTGGSAGGYLTAMAALTENDPEFQPGFETADTSVSAAVPFYGVYDLVDANANMVKGFHEQFLEPIVMGTEVAEDRERWERYSPVSRVHTQCPPIMLLHGSADTLVPVGQGREFAAALRGASDHTVVYAELAGANHAFDIFGSPRCNNAVEYVERFLTGVHRGLIK